MQDNKERLQQTLGKASAVCSCQHIYRIPYAN